MIEEDADEICTHLATGVKVNNLKRSLAHGDLSTCRACVDEGAAATDRSLWLCLHCAMPLCAPDHRGAHAAAHRDHGLFLLLGGGRAGERNAEEAVACLRCPGSMSTGIAVDLNACAEMVDRQRAKQMGTRFSSASATRTLSAIGEAKKARAAHAAITSTTTKTSKAKGVQQAKASENTVPASVVAGGETLEEAGVVFLVKEARSRGRPPIPRGLSNLGNTCFFNSVLQSLACARFWEERTLRHTFNTLFEARPYVEGEMSLTKALFDVLRELNQRHTSHSTVVPSILLREVARKYPNFRGGRQQDSMELLLALFDGIKMEEKRCLAPTATQSLRPGHGQVEPPSHVNVAFGGRFLNQIICHRCERWSLTSEPFLTVTVPVELQAAAQRKGKIMSLLSPNTVTPHPSIRKRALLPEPYEPRSPAEISVPSGLARVASPSTLANGNAYLCEHCNKKSGSDLVQETQNKLTLVATSDASDQEEEEEEEVDPKMAKTSRKASTHIFCEATRITMFEELPKFLILHLNRFAQRANGLSKSDKRVGYEATLDLAPFCADSVSGTTGYRLFAVVEHNGSLNSGHYTAHVAFDAANWFHISDSHASNSSLNRALLADAYLLFYARDDCVIDDDRPSQSNL